MRLLVGRVLLIETRVRRPTILLQVQHGQFKRPSQVYGLKDRLRKGQ